MLSLYDKLQIKEGFLFCLMQSRPKICNIQKKRYSPLKRFLLEKSRKKKSKFLNFKNSIQILKKSLRGILTPYLEYIHTKFGINETSRLGVSLYTQILRQILCFIVIRDQVLEITEMLFMIFLQQIRFRNKHLVFRATLFIRNTCNIFISLNFQNNSMFSKIILHIYRFDIKNVV